MIYAAEFTPTKTNAPPSIFRLHPKIDLVVCPWCKGSTKFTIGRKTFPCTQCAGRGSIVTDNA